jgi:hypothetical protein
VIKKPAASVIRRWPKASQAAPLEGNRPPHNGQPGQVVPPSAAVTSAPLSSSKKINAVVIAESRLNGTFAL